MSLSIQEISDRFEIKDLLIDYCTAIDSRDFDALDNIFTPDAHIDYTCFGGPKGKFPEIKTYLEKALPNFPSYQHMLGNSRVWLEGDQARARTICHNPMVIPRPDGSKQTAFFGLWYVDKLVRTKEGWRLSERLEEAAYIHNMPKDFSAIQA